MSGTIDIYKRVERERRTEKKVREFDAHEIVEWIHSLEDQIEYMENSLRECLETISEATKTIKQITNNK